MLLGDITTPLSNDNCSDYRCQRKLIIVRLVEWGETITFVQEIVISETIKSDFWTFHRCSPGLNAWCKGKREKTCLWLKRCYSKRKSDMCVLESFRTLIVLTPFCDQVITNLVKMVKARDIRRPFCPSGHWLSEEVNIRADKVNEWKRILFIYPLWCS